MRSGMDPPRTYGLLFFIAVAPWVVPVNAGTVSITSTDDLGAAVAGLQSGDTLQLGAGTYSTNACYIDVSAGKTITISGTAGQTVIECGAAGRHLNVFGGATVSLVGITLQNGAANLGGCIKVAGTGTTVNLINSKLSSCSASQSGGALHVTGGGAVVLEGSVIQQSSATEYGGGAFLDASSVVARSQSQIKQNSAVQGAGLYLTNSASLTLQSHTSLSSNTASGTNSESGDGGGVFSRGSTITLTDALLSQNQCTNNGGAIHAHSSTVIVQGSTEVARNTALKGAGIFLESSTATLSGPVVADSNLAYGGGSVIYAKSSTLTVSASMQLSNNNVPGTWNINGICTNQPKANAAFDNGITQEGGTCSSACVAGFYEHVDNMGDLMTSGTSCHACTTDACAVGQYRGACAGRTNGVCTACTNRISKSQYTSPGVPYNANNCAYACRAGYGWTGTACVSCEQGTYKSDAGNTPCTPSCSTGYYSSRTLGLTAPECFPCTATPCSHGYTRSECGHFNDTECVVCPPVPAANADYVADGTCEWACLHGHYRVGDMCQECPTSECEVGQYRGLCQGYSSGECTNCTNAPTAAYYTSSGQPYNSNTCSWTCDGVHHNENTSPAEGLHCGIGHYPGWCECETCSNAPSNSVYTSVGMSLQNDCAWVCAEGHGGEACEECGAGHCDVGHKRGPCNHEEAGKCKPCTNKPEEARYVEHSDHGECAWECEAGYYAHDEGCSPCSVTQCGVGEYRGQCSATQDAPCIPCTTKTSASACYTTPGEPYNHDTCQFKLDCGEIVNKTSCNDMSIEFIAVLAVRKELFNQNVYFEAVSAVANRAAGHDLGENCISIKNVRAVQTLNPTRRWTVLDNIADVIPLASARGRSDATITPVDTPWTAITTVLQVNETDIVRVATAMTAESLTRELASRGFSITVKRLILSNETVTLIAKYQHTGQSGDNKGAIIGGVIGGVFGALFLIALVWRLMGWEVPSFVKGIGEGVSKCFSCFKSSEGQMKNKSGGKTAAEKKLLKESKNKVHSANGKQEKGGEVKIKNVPAAEGIKDIELSSKPELINDSLSSDEDGHEKA